jgi:hypothetical protein
MWRASLTLLPAEWRGGVHRKTGVKRYAVAFCGLLSACAAVGPIYTPAPAPQGTDALVYIYRMGGLALAARDAHFYVDDVNVTILSREGYAWFHVPAGEYTVKQTWSADVSPKTIQLKARWLPGRTYFYRLETSPGFGYVEWRLTAVPVDQGMAEIGRCKLQPAFGAERLRGAATTK